MYLFERLIATIAPHRCLACGRTGTPLCLLCSETLPPVPKCCYKCGEQPATRGLCNACRPTSGLKTIGIRTSYTGLAEQVIQALKFQRNQAAATAVAHSMKAVLAGTDTQVVIAHIPTANSRVRQRGYDQARLIARALAAADGRRYQALLSRQGKTRQLGSSRADRQQQLQGVFSVMAKHPPWHTPIILVDDVVTTGSTFEAAALALINAGYQNIHALAFAWTQPGDQ